MQHHKSKFNYYRHNIDSISATTFFISAKNTVHIGVNLLITGCWDDKSGAHSSKESLLNDMIECVLSVQVPRTFVI